MDTLTTIERSVRMSLVRSKDTKPELLVRRLIHSMGYRYRLHDRKLPGCPDVVFASRRKVIFIHGCFWHQHKCALGDRMPKSRLRFWRAKLAGNKARDARNRQSLRRGGWRALTVWECQLHPRRLDKLAVRIAKFIDDSQGRSQDPKCGQPKPVA